MRKRDAKRQQAFRLPESMIGRLDRYAERLRRERPGLEVSRADAVRLLLAAALDQEERHGKG
ncbi:MAG TPA: hypothetical protein VF841_00440 [Anaeromyxobacter sp.]